MGGGNVDMWHACMYIVPNCNIVVALVAHLQQF
jgi:hypothetical protein